MFVRQIVLSVLILLKFLYGCQSVVRFIEIFVGCSHLERVINVTLTGWQLTRLFMYKYTRSRPSHYSNFLVLIEQKWRRLWTVEERLANPMTFVRSVKLHQLLLVVYRSFLSDKLSENFDESPTPLVAYSAITHPFKVNSFWNRTRSFVFWCVPEATVLEMRTKRLLQAHCCSTMRVAIEIIKWSCLAVRVCLKLNVRYY
jgi:nitrogen regulatory protein PII-like uncharacterized protein